MDSGNGKELTELLQLRSLLGVQLTVCHWMLLSLVVLRLRLLLLRVDGLRLRVRVRGVDRLPWLSVHWLWRISGLLHAQAVEPAARSSP